MASGTLRLRNEDDATLLHVPLRNILYVTSKWANTLQQHRRNLAQQIHMYSWHAALQQEEEEEDKTPKVNVFTVKIFWKSPEHKPLWCSLVETELELLSRCLASGRVESASAPSEELD